MPLALLVVDVQQNMVAGPYAVPNSPIYLERFAARIETARERGETVIFVQNDGPEGDIDEPGSEGWQLWFEPRADERVVRKTTQNVFESNPGLADDLRALDVEQIELIGMQSEYCVQASARGAKAHGFSVSLNPELHATFHDGTPATNAPGSTYEVSATELAARVHAELVADGTLTHP
jgi:nicotinamidase-related amidase